MDVNFKKCTIRYKRLFSEPPSFIQNGVKICGHNSGIPYVPYSFRVRIGVRIRVRIRIRVGIRIMVRVRIRVRD